MKEVPPIAVLLKHAQSRHQAEEYAVSGPRKAGNKQMAQQRPLWRSPSTHPLPLGSEAHRNDQRTTTVSAACP